MPETGIFTLFSKKVCICQLFEYFSNQLVTIQCVIFQA